MRRLSKCERPIRVPQNRINVGSELYNWILRLNRTQVSKCMSEWSENDWFFCNSDLVEIRRFILVRTKINGFFFWHGESRIKKRAKVPVIPLNYRSSFAIIIHTWLVPAWKYQIMANEECLTNIECEYFTHCTKHICYT